MTNPEDVTLQTLAEQVLSDNPKGTKDEWARALQSLVGPIDGSERWQAEAFAKYLSALGQYVASRAAAIARAAAAEARDATENAVSYSGRPMTQTMSIRHEDGSTQLVLWINASPAKYVEAVFREQAVSTGRVNSNKVRMQLARILLDDESLMALPTLADVCAVQGIDPDSLGLDELDESA